MPLTSSMEDYLEAVLVLQQQKGYVRCVDVAELLDVKKPSVSRAVKELSKKKCLIKKDDGTLSSQSRASKSPSKSMKSTSSLPNDSWKLVFHRILQHKTLASWSMLLVR